MSHDQAVLTRALERSRRLTEQDEDLRRQAPLPEARARIVAEADTSLRCLMLACRLYGDRPALADRTGPSGAKRTISFAGLWAEVEAAASGMARRGIAAEGDRIGLCGFPSIDWVIVDLACLYLGAVSVPLPTAATAAEIASLARDASLSAVVSSAALLDRVLEGIASAPSVRRLLVMDVGEGEAAARSALDRAREAERRGGIAVEALPDLIREGRARGVVPPVLRVDGDALRTLMYTSGSTGSPKGAMFPERLWLRHWQGTWPGDLPEVPHVGADYLPLNHMAGRGSVLRSIMAGGRTSFVRAADLSTIFEDIQAARPTSLFLVPRLASAVYQRFQAEVARQGAPEAEVMAGMRRSLLGDRIVYLMTGTAPTAPEVAEFLERCFDIPVIDGYGSTEAGAITVDGRIVGENVVAYKIVDVPELGYHAYDRPHPRGELRVKTRRMVPGYLGNPAATADLFDEEGYLCTGDVVEVRAPEEIAVVDRKKNVIKLAQGEFVAISRLEEVYAAGSPKIRQVFLYASGLWSYLLAVVVPEGAVDKATLAEEIRRVAAREGLKPYEIPRDLLVETDPWTRENGMLTESDKPARPRLRARYGERLEALHAAIERSRRAEADRIARDQGARGGGPADAAETVARALAATMGIEGLDPAQLDRSFVDLGGDSLAAAELSSRIQDAAGVTLPVGQILDRTGTVRGLTRAVDDRIRGGGRDRRPSFADVHGAGARTVRAADLSIDRFLSAEDLSRREDPAREGGAGAVLVTGANGFLGRFLLLEILDRAASSGREVVALVRARDDASAAARLAEAYEGVDPTLPARFATLSRGRLTVLAGDLIAPRLGLSPDRWEAIGRDLGVVVHNGALVNHALSYAQLFEPNVLGTVELMRLALRARASIAFVSSVGVAGGLDRTGPVREDEDAASLFPSRPVDSGYAVGYGTSKWADEILLGALAARAGVPIAVLRCSMILPPAAYVGQVNAGDLFTRLLHGMVVTGLAPRSFYAPGAPAPGFDGLPADFVARTITSIALAPEPGFSLYHVVEARPEGASLDRIADWVEAAGYDLRRVDDHAEWVDEMRERLSALPPAEQQRSVLPVIERWERPLGRELSFDNRALRARLAALSGGTPPEIPAIDALSVQQYLRNMVYRGLIGHPGFCSAA